MTTKLKVIIGISALVIASASVATGVIITNHDHGTDGAVVEHSGGLDKCGGHNDRKQGTYHYHQGPYC